MDFKYTDEKEREREKGGDRERERRERKRKSKEIVRKRSLKQLCQLKMSNDKIPNAEILGNGRSSNDREGKENDLKDSRKRQQREIESE